MSVLSDSDEIFKSGEVFSASDEKLDAMLKGFASEWHGPASETLTLTRVAIINVIKQQRHIDKIESRNQVYTWIIIALSATAIITQVLPLVLTKCAN